MKALASVIQVNLSRCTGCRQCEVTCSFAKAGVFTPRLARIRVTSDHIHGLFAPAVCRQCAKAPCAEACPTDALVRDPRTGAVVLVDDLCIGCRACAEACPFGCIGFVPDEDLPLKCDLCGGRPECVEACFQGALTFVPRDEVGLMSRLRYGRKQVDVMRIQREETSR